MLRIVECLLGAVWLVFSSVHVRAEVANPYQGIVDRNVFNLKAVPSPDSIPATPPTPPAKVTLTAITTISGPKRVYLRVGFPPRPPEPAKEESVDLTVGQSQGDIEVESIDEVGGIVRIKNRGIPQTLDFDKNGSKLQASAPTALPVPGVVAPPPITGVPSPTSGQNPLRQIPTRQLRVPSTGGNSPGGVPPVQGGSANVPPVPQNLSPEEQVIGIEINRMLHKDNPDYAPLPTTEMTPQ